MCRRIFRQHGKRRRLGRTHRMGTSSRASAGAHFFRVAPTTTASQPEAKFTFCRIMGKGGHPTSTSGSITANIMGTSPCPIQPQLCHATQTELGPAIINDSFTPYSFSATIQAFKLCCASSYAGFSLCHPSSIPPHRCILTHTARQAQPFPSSPSSSSSVVLCTSCTF